MPIDHEGGDPPVLIDYSRFGRHGVPYLVYRYTIGPAAGHKNNCGHVHFAKAR